MARHGQKALLAAGVDTDTVAGMSQAEQMSAGARSLPQSSRFRAKAAEITSKLPADDSMAPTVVKDGASATTVGRGSTHTHVAQKFLLEGMVRNLKGNGTNKSGKKYKWDKYWKRDASRKWRSCGAAESAAWVEALRAALRAAKAAAADTAAAAAD